MLKLNSEKNALESFLMSNSAIDWLVLGTTPRHASIRQTPLEQWSNTDYKGGKMC